MIPQANAKFSPMNTNNLHFNDSPDQNKMQYPGLNFAELSPFNAKGRPDLHGNIGSPHVQNQFAPYTLEDDHNHLQPFTSLKNAWPKAQQSPYIHHEDNSPGYFNKTVGAPDRGFDNYITGFSKTGFGGAEFSAFKNRSPTKLSQFNHGSPRIMNADQINNKI